jgi:hypothetical protein
MMKPTRSVSQISIAPINPSRRQTKSCQMVTRSPVEMENPSMICELRVSSSSPTYFFLYVHHELSVRGSKESRRKMVVHRITFPTRHNTDCTNRIPDRIDLDHLPWHAESPERCNRQSRQRRYVETKRSKRLTRKIIIVN